LQTEKGPGYNYGKGNFLDIDGVLKFGFWKKSHQKEISNGTLINKEKIILQTAGIYSNTT